MSNFPISNTSNRLLLRPLLLPYVSRVKNKKMDRLLLGIYFLVCIFCYLYRLTSPSTNELDYDLPDYSELYPNQELADYSDGQQSFNSTGTDTFVFLHIQKTGGTTLGRRFVEDIGKSIKNKNKNMSRVVQAATRNLK